MNDNKLNNSKNNFLSKRNVLMISFFAIILIIISVCVSIFFLGIKFDTIANISNKPFNEEKGLWLFLILLCMLYIIFWNSFYLYRYSKRYNINAKFYEWIIYGLVSIFFNSVTPFSIGSEPYRVYWLNKHGLTGRQSLLVISSTTIFWSAAQILITWPSFIYVSTKYSLISQTTDGLIAYWFTFGGMLIDLFVFILILSISISRRCHVFLNHIFNQILKKLKKPYKTKVEIIEEYKIKATFRKEYLQEMKKWNNLILQMVGTILYSLAYYFAVYFSFRLVDLNEFSFSNIYHITNVAWTANNFIPIPGGEGTVQIILQKFLVAFENKPVNIDNVNGAIFVWRSFTFYIPTLVGLVLLPYVVVDYMKAKKKEKTNIIIKV